jgi:D-arabinose 1-dehydrogenase-like Zn-dependent alcohol dehydrogenase
LENEIMSNDIRGWAARGAKQPLEPFAYNGSLNVGPTMTSAMLDFAARHKITPQVERFPMSKVNDALEHLAAGKARYGVVLKPDFA